MNQSQERLKPWLTPEQVEEIRVKYTTIPVDGNGFEKGVVYGTLMVRNDVTKLVAEVKRIQEERDRYKAALEWYADDTIWIVTESDGVYAIEPLEYCTMDGPWSKAQNALKGADTQ